MENSEQKIEELKQKEYFPVWVYNSTPDEEDPSHEHDYDTHLLIIEGEIEIKMDGKTIILKSSDEVDIPRGKIHYGKAGKNGCKYIVAEKH